MSLQRPLRSLGISTPDLFQVWGTDGSWLICHFLKQVNGLTIPLAPLQAAVQMAADVYCEGNFAGLYGKTSHGLVRFCEAFEV